MIKLAYKFWPIILITLVWFVFSSPFFIKGLTPFASLYQSNFFSPWSAYSIYEGPVKNNAMPDIITQLYPWRTFTIDSLKTGIVPLWNPYSFAGTPHLANYQSAPFSPFNILFFLPLSFVNAWSLLVLLQPLLAGLSMFLLLRSYKLNNVSQAFGAISFMFCGFLTSWMGYATLGYAILFLPLAIFSVNKFIDTRNGWYTILLSISIATSLLSGHFQTSVYFLSVLFLYIVFFGYKNKKSFGLILLSFMSGILISMPQILPSIEFYLNSVRQEIVTQLEVIPLGYLPTLFAPDIFGNPVTRNDWYGHYAEWNGFAGTVALLLAIFSAVFLLSRDRKVLFYLLLGVFSLLIAFETPLNLLIFNLKLPLFSTSASSRIIVLFSVAVAVLSAYGVHYLTSNLKNFSKKHIVFLTSLVLVFLSSLWIIPFFNLLNEVDKTQIAKSNLVLPTLLSLAFIIAIVFQFFFKSKKVSIALFSIVILGLITVDMLRFSTKWMPFEPKDLVFKDVGVSKFYKDNYTEKRYLGNFSAENSVFYRIQTLGGYDPLYPKRYGEFVKFVDLGKKEDGDRSVVNFPLNSVRTKKAADFLGVEYIPQKKSDDGKAWSFDFKSYPADDFEIVYEDEVYRVFKNKSSFSRAYIVGNYEIGDNDFNILQRMFSSDVDLGKQVLLEKDPGIEKNDDLVSEVNILDYNSNNVRISANSSDTGLLVLTDNYYNGWKAYINNKESEIYRANYAFRAVVVPLGESVVEFRYEPESFRYGLYAAVLGSIILVLTFIYIKKYGIKN